MNKRLSVAAAAATLAAVPLLAACGGGGDAQPAGSTAPTASQAAPSTSTSTEPGPSPSPTPTLDKASESKAVTDATEKFVKTALTIGYPDKSFADNTDRLKPLMTDDGYTAIKNSKSIKEDAKSLKTLYNARARSYPQIKGDVKVARVSAEVASTNLEYQSEIQRKSGGDWTKVQTLSKEAIEVSLVKQDGNWLVDDAQ